MALPLLIERKQQNKIIHVTMNRPEKLNAISKEIFDQLYDLLDVLETDKQARVVILTGSGQKSFCVGADLKERMGMNEKDVIARLDFVRKLYTRIEKASVPFIAAINGLALGGGLELALACDLRITTPEAIFGFPEVKLAIIPGNGGTQRISRVVGLGKAMEWVLTGKKFTSQEALQFGVVSEIVDNSHLKDRSFEIAQDLMLAGPIALKMAKQSLQKGYDMTLDEALKYEVDSYKKCLYSQDRLEGLKAFKEKRTPDYKGV